MEKLRIGLFIGGASSEKEISLESGRHVYNSLDRDKYEILPIFVDDGFILWQIDEGLLWKNTTTDLKESLNGSGERVYFEDLKTRIDYAFSCLHGKFGEEAFPGLLEILGLPSNCASVLGGALSMDKYRQRLIFKASGIDTPKFVPVRIDQFMTGREQVLDSVENELSYPVMVKPSREGSSTALHKAYNRGDLSDALSDALNYDNLVLVEEVLEGTELTTLVYGSHEEAKALVPSELLKGGAFLTAEEKFLPGGAQMITPPRLSDEQISEVKVASVKTFKALGLMVYSRIDSFYVPGRGVVILEPNNPPAMTPSTALWLEAAEEGFNAARFLDLLIDLSLKLHSTKIGPL